MGAGDDTFVWNPGDGSDRVDGQGGNDTLQFNGANVNENISISANGRQVRLSRDVGNVTMDLNDVERVDVNALGGADTITVNDLTGTALTEVNLNLGATGGGGDGQADTVIVNGTNASDNINVFGRGTSASVVGLHAVVNVTNAEGANDALVVNALGGDDVVSASTMPAGVIQLTLDGGAGNDVILGSQGADTLLGGDGNDFIDGKQGNDVALMGAGDDVVQWDPGDGSDVVEGQGGHDAMVFNGANVTENIDISANGQRVRFFRDVGNVTMDLNGVERIDFNARGGADTITVNDLTGTDVTEVNIDLAQSPGSGVGDGQADTVIVNGTNGDDAVTVGGGPGGVAVVGLSAVVNIRGGEAANDLLFIRTQAGDDVVDASGLAAGAIRLVADGGDGDDVLIGGAGNATLLGGAGDDVLISGPGPNTLDGGPGANTLIP
jgi:Ca2+-binding RTX toxin-like protein